MNTETMDFVPYYVMMDEIWNRLGELNQMTIAHYKTNMSPAGTYITEETPEYLEQESLIKRWYELHAYEKALSGALCKNSLLVDLRLDAILDGLNCKNYDRTVAIRIAYSVYENKPCL